MKKLFCSVAAAILLCEPVHAQKASTNKPVTQQQIYALNQQLNHYNYNYRPPMGIDLDNLCTEQKNICESYANDALASLDNNKTANDNTARKLPIAIAMLGAVGKGTFRGDLIKKIITFLTTDYPKQSPYWIDAAKQEVPWSTMTITRPPYTDKDTDRQKDLAALSQLFACYSLPNTGTFRQTIQCPESMCSSPTSEKGQQWAWESLTLLMDYVLPPPTEQSLNILKQHPTNPSIASGAANTLNKPPKLPDRQPSSRHQSAIRIAP